VEVEARAEAVRYRTPIQELALLVGLAMLGIGIAGFIPGLTTHYGDLSFAGDGSSAKLFGVFQVSILQNVVHLVLGAAGVMLSRARVPARGFLVAGGVFYLVLFLYGFFTSQRSGANFIPLDRADDFLDAALGGSMLVVGLIPEELDRSATDNLAGFLAAAAIFVAAIGVAWRPLRLVPAAILLSLIAVGIGGRNERLATAATFIGAACFVLGLAFAVVTSHPLW
jgi:Domain of unknown function (DUF4383)